MARWQEVAEEAQRHRDATIDSLKPPLPALPRELSHHIIEVPRRLLSQQEVAITEAPITVLLGRLANGEITATAVASAFLRRAAIAQKLVGIGSIPRCLAYPSGAGQLHFRAIAGASFGSREGARRCPGTWRSAWAAARPPNQREGSYAYEGPSEGGGIHLGLRGCQLRRCGSSENTVECWRCLLLPDD